MNKGKIMRKLLGQSTNNSNEVSDTINHTNSPQQRSSASQNTVYSAGSPLTCLGRSPDGQRAVIAGSKVFKIVKIEGSTITEDIDLRTAISSYAARSNDQSATAEQLNIKAIRWSHSAYDSTIVTAGGNGRISVYDLNRAGEGFEVARIQEHARQVHKLAINPFKGNWLLSASQDGSIRCFDLRDPRHSVSIFKCNADAVRDVKWSPTDGMEFACSTDAGIIQKWDFRKSHAPSLKITAHNTAVPTISWHPDGDHLISGGKDQQCHVWDISKSAERGQRPRYSFSTPAPVSNVCWRPACWSATGQGNRAAQVAVTYDDSSANRAQFSTVHVWDIARPTMPYKEIDQSSSSPTGILWSTRDLLWSVDKDGRFTQTDVVFSPKVIDRRSFSTFSFSPTGDVLMVLEERQPLRRPRPSINSPQLSPSFPQHSSLPSFVASQSDSEEDVGSFLGARRRRHHLRRHSGRSTQTLSTTPPSATGMADNRVMTLEGAVQITGVYKPRQVIAIGHAPSTSSRTIYQYLSNCYLDRMTKNAFRDTENTPLNATIAATMEHFANGAEGVGHYRLAQTWRLLAFTMDLLLVRRAEAHRQSRLQKHANKEGRRNHLSNSTSEEHEEPTEATPRKTQQLTNPNETGLHPAVRSIIADEIESTSNMTTPLVRPVNDSIIEETTKAMDDSMVDNDKLRLPPAMTAPISVPGSYESGQTTSSIEGYDFYGMDSFKPTVDFVPPKKQPLRLDYPDHNSYAQRMGLARHDSGESFQMFSTSADSQPRLSESGSDAHSVRKDDVQSLRERVSSWEGSFASQSKPGSVAHSHPSEESMERIPEEPMKVLPNPPRISTPNHVHRKLSPPSLTVESPSENDSSDPGLIETDFLPWPADNSTEFVIPPLDPIILVQRAIAFETQTSPLNAAAMILLLRRLLPENTVDPIHAEAVLRQYHHRLISMQLFQEAALLRNLCVPVYSSVYAPSQEQVSVGFHCTECDKPLENDPLVPGSCWRCPRCRSPIAACPVCGHREDAVAPVSDTGTATWWYCGGCGHGGHMNCMMEWHAAEEGGLEGDKFSEGMCPLVGCMHACLPGKWREELAEEKKERKIKELEKAVKENTSRGWETPRGKGVRRDVREVGQSRAVEGVRAALGFGGGGLNTTGAGAGQVVERRRSVKVMAPGEEGQ